MGPLGWAGSEAGRQGRAQERALPFTLGARSSSHRPPRALQVLVDDIDVRSIGLRCLRRQMALVGQEPVMFRCGPVCCGCWLLWEGQGAGGGEQAVQGMSPALLRPLCCGWASMYSRPAVLPTLSRSGTILDNLTFGSGATPQQVADAARAAQAMSFIEALPEGLATRLGDGGGQLSGGQLQRLAIARAILRRPRVGGRVVAGWGVRMPQQQGPHLSHQL